METRIAENIRAYRKQHGLTQEQLAETLGVSTGAVYNGNPDRPCLNCGSLWRWRISLTFLWTRCWGIR